MRTSWCHEICLLYRGVLQKRGFADLCSILTVMHFYVIITYVSVSAVDKLATAISWQ